MATNQQNSKPQQPIPNSTTSTSTTNPFETIISFFTSVSAPVTSKHKFSHRLASIHSAVDHELHPSYMADWDRAFNSRHRSCTTTSNDSILSTLSYSSSSSASGNNATTNDQSGRLTKEALAWYWPEAGPEPENATQSKTTVTVKSKTLDPRRSAL